jgi:hypothetical protein
MRPRKPASGRLATARPDSAPELQQHVGDRALAFAEPVRIVGRRQRELAFAELPQAPGELLGVVGEPRRTLAQGLGGDLRRLGQARQHQVEVAVVERGARADRQVLGAPRGLALQHVGLVEVPGHVERVVEALGAEQRDGGVGGDLGHHRVRHAELPAHLRQQRLILLGGLVGAA